MYPDFHIQHGFKIPALHDLSRALHAHVNDAVYDLLFNAVPNV